MVQCVRCIGLKVPEMMLFSLTLTESLCEVNTKALGYRR